MNDAQTIVDMMIESGADYHVINDTLMLGEYEGEYWIVDCSVEFSIARDAQADALTINPSKSKQSPGCLFQGFFAWSSHAVTHRNHSIKTAYDKRYTPMHTPASTHINRRLLGVFKALETDSIDILESFGRFNGVGSGPIKHRFH